MGARVCTVSLHMRSASQIHSCFTLSLYFHFIFFCFLSRLNERYARLNECYAGLNERYAGLNERYAVLN